MTEIVTIFGPVVLGGLIGIGLFLATMRWFT